MIVFERLCLRDEIMASANPEQAWRELTTTSPGVVARVAQAEREFAVSRCLQPAVGPREREEHGAGSVVGDVWQALAAAVGHCTACARAGRRRFRRRAQLVSLWPDPGRPQISHVSPAPRTSSCFATKRCMCSCACKMQGGAQTWSVGSRMRTLTDQRKKVSTTRWLSLVLLDRHERARAGEGACVGSFRELRYTRYTVYPPKFWIHWIHI